MNETTANLIMKRLEPIVHEFLKEKVLSMLKDNCKLSTKICFIYAVDNIIKEWIHCETMKLENLE